MSFSNWFFVSWIKKYESNKVLYKFLLSFMIILFVLTIFIGIFVLPLIYLGIVLQRKKTFPKIKKALFKLRKRKRILYYIAIAFIIFFFAMFCLMIFTIPILLLIYLGVRFERFRTTPRIIHNPYNVENVQLRKDKNILSQGRL